MALTVSMRSLATATVFRLEGVVDDSILDLVAEGLANAISEGTVVLDLADLVLAQPRWILEAVRRIADLPGTDVRLVCPRLTGRRLLLRYLNHCPVRVFPSIDAATAEIDQAKAPT